MTDVFPPSGKNTSTENCFQIKKSILFLTQYSD